MNIRLINMTIPLIRQFFREFAYDPDTFENPINCLEYHYSQETADAFYRKHQRPDREHFAIMRDDEIVGDLYLKDINLADRSCTLSIHMKNNSVKNKGYGSIAIHLALNHAFDILLLEYVFADALIKNDRSQYVLEKAGFQELRRDEKYIYYICYRVDCQFQGKAHPKL